MVIMKLRFERNRDTYFIYHLRFIAMKPSVNLKLCGIKMAKVIG